jgi:hypothetical protein
VVTAAGSALGALRREAIDMAVILNSLRALRAPATARVTDDHTALTRRFRTEHQTIRADIDELRAAADALDAPGAMARVRQVYDILTREVWPHESAEEAKLYPSLYRLLGGADPNLAKTKRATGDKRSPATCLSIRRLQRVAG